MDKTNKVKNVFEKIGLQAELKRTSKKKIRAGKGKARGRVYKKKQGPLIIIAEESKLQKAVKNIPGVESCLVKNLNAEILAPGANSGRLVIWTEGAIEKLSKERLFV